MATGGWRVRVERMVGWRKGERRGDSVRVGVEGRWEDGKVGDVDCDEKKSKIITSTSRDGYRWNN